MDRSTSKGYLYTLDWASPQSMDWLIEQFWLYMTTPTSNYDSLPRPLPLCILSHMYSMFSTIPPPTQVQPFYLTHIQGNICKCYGCGQSYNKPAIEPYNLCIQHKGMRTFYVAGSPLSRQHMGNCYHHLSERSDVSISTGPASKLKTSWYYLKLPSP